MVNSNITLTASMRSNLMSLKTIATQMDRTQNILSTGKKVNSAIDNASSYYQARSLTNRAGDLNSLLDAMGQGIQTIQAATQGLESATAYLEQMKSVAEQALTMEAKPMTSQVQLTDNSAELLEQGYHAIDSSMSAQDIMDLIVDLYDAGEEIKLVLTEDVEIDDYFEFYESDVTINGGGHTLKLTNEYGQLYIGGENATIENMAIEHTGTSSNIIYGEGSGLTLRNININHEYTDLYNATTVSLYYGGTLENVNINTKATSVLVGVYSYAGDLDITNLTMNIDASNSVVTGVYAADDYDEGKGNVLVNGMSITSNARDTKGIWATGNINGVENSGNYANTIPSSLTDGKANTQAIVNKLKKDGKAAYATTQFYVGDKYGYFGQGKWYLPSIGELMDLYGTDYEAITDGHGKSGAYEDGSNMSAINTTLAGLGDIAEKMNGGYWSSSEYNYYSSWLLYSSDGIRYSLNKNYSNHAARAFRLVENCFNPSLLSGAAGAGVPAVGDIMYQDGTWGTLDDYDTSKASQVAGVICDVGDDGSVKVVSLKDLTFSSNDDAGVFNPEDPYGGSTKYVRWATSDNGKWKENITAISDVDAAGLVASFNPSKGVSVQDINNAFAEIDVKDNHKQYSSIMTQFDELVEDASYQGVNLLTGGNLTVTFNESRSHELKVVGKDMRTEKLGLSNKEWKSKADIESALEELTTAMGKIRSFSAELGNNYAIIQTRQDFTDALVDVLQTGADNLVLADMNEASAQYLMLQTRQQLATNSLSLASQSAQSILSLF